MEDKFNLERFEARHKETYDTAYQELKKGKKQSHWMWWIFPQICGLGISWIIHILVIILERYVKFYLK